MNRQPLLIALTLLLFFSYNCTKSQKAEDIEQPRDSIKKIFSHYCLSCHGSDFRKLIKPSEILRHSLKEIQSYIRNGVLEKGMPAFDDLLTEPEVEALSQYVQELARAPKVTKYTEGGAAQNTNDRFRVEEVITDLEIPWGIEFLPNGDLLVAERKGTLLRVTPDKKRIPIKGVPKVLARGQGGLMDLKLHPNYSENGWLYISYSYVDATESSAGNTAVVRCQLENDHLRDLQLLYKGLPTVRSFHHFGSRLAFDNQGYLYISNGDRGRRDKFPQKLNNSNGKIHRLHDDGRIPTDNPFYNTEGAVKSIFSYGHRNPQGVAKHPITGDIWIHEHGPKGGDEINLIKAGKNYGWPLASFGINYSGSIFTKDTALVGTVQPLKYYVPSIAPCGMAFITSKRYGDWENNLLIGSLSFKYLEMCVLERNKVIRQEKLLEGIGRVREVKVSPDGYIYLGVESPGRVLKLVPTKE